MSTNLPPLPTVDVEQLLSFDHPARKIRTEEDVERWHRSKGFATYMLFLHRINEAVTGRSLEDEELVQSASPNVTTLANALTEIESWVDEVPLQSSPQRFGNLAFREWGKLLEQRSTALLTSLLPDALAPAVPHIRPYLLESFGSFGRIDYGSGHELSFAIFLLCLFRLGFFTSEDEATVGLLVFRRYLQVVWRLQDTYKLEPAGSHGVWGLDDWHFLPYLWGSAQLRNDTSLSPTSILGPRPLPATNLYYLCINRIHALKSGGPFHEHSPQLYSIATGVTLQAGGWRKVNSGMMKMYLAEVLSKRVVVQHTPIGGLLDWDEVEGEGGGGGDFGKNPDTSGTRVLSGQGTMGPPPLPSAFPSASTRLEFPGPIPRPGAETSTTYPRSTGFPPTRFPSTTGRSDSPFARTRAPGTSSNAGSASMPPSRAPWAPND